MKMTLLLALLTSTSIFAADVDYSRCSSGGMGGFGLDNDGKLITNSYMSIKSKSTDGNVEKYKVVFHNDVYGGQGSMEQEVSITRDKEGRVIAMKTGKDEFSKKEIKAYKETVLNSLVEGSYFQAENVGSPNGFGFGYGFGGYGGAPSERQFFVDGKYVSLRKLTKDQRKTLEIDDETYEAMVSKFKKDKKAKAKIRKGLAPAMEKAAHAMFLGTDATFEIKDGVCTPKTLSSRVYNSVSGEVTNQSYYSSEACTTVKNIHTKFQARLSACNTLKTEIDQDLGDHKEIADISGMGVGPYVYGNNDQLTALYYQCQMYEHPYGSGAANGSGETKEVKKDEKEKGPERPLLFFSSFLPIDGKF